MGTWFSRFILIGMILTVSACGSGASGSTSDVSSSGGSYSGDSLEGGSVSEVEIDEANGSALITFGEQAGSEEYVLAISSYKEAGSSSSFQLNSINGNTTSQALTKDSEVSLSNSEDIKNDDLSAADQFHNQLRLLEEELDFSDVSSTTLKGAKKDSEPELGSERSFKVLSSLSGGSYTNRTATLIYSTSHFFIYSDNEELSSYYPSSEIASDIQEMIDDFELQYDDFVALLGEPSDVDSNGKVIIFFTPQVNRLGSSVSGGGFVTGFFYPKDLTSDNKADMLYISVHDAAGDNGVVISKSFYDSNIGPGVIRHELQHLMNANRRLLENGFPAMSSSFNEALSHLAEDFIYDMEWRGDENPSRVALFLASISTINPFLSTSITARGGSYLFMRYLMEQADLGNLNGVSNRWELIQGLLDNSETGINGLVQVINGSNAGTNYRAQFREIWSRFSLAVFLSNTGLSDDNRLGLTGINLRSSSQNDNRSTVLKGPVLQSISSFPMTNSIGGGSISYVKITADDIQEAGGGLALQLGSDTEFGAYLIQTAE